MASERFALALDQLAPEQWRDFERLAADFLVVEFPSLRTMAAAAGDKGRDGELYFPTEDSVTTVLQYSVTGDWRSKIAKTVTRLKDNFSDIQHLVYVTNQSIGPAADDVKRALRDAEGISLDIRDKSWFVERELTSPQRQAAAAELAERYVDPLLRARGVTENVATVLNDDEGRIALLHLSLDIQDKATDKGLTKSCFESLVLSALDGTSSSSLVQLEEIQARVRRLLPAGNGEQVNALVKSALSRLTGKGGPVNYHKSENGYCLSFAGSAAANERIARYVAQEGELEDQLARLVGTLQVEDGVDPRDIAKDLRLGIDHLLLEKGESFVRAVATGRMPQLNPEEAASVLSPILKRSFPLTTEQAVGVILDAIQRPTRGTQDHLRRLSDAYTLFAFLRQTVDVQKTVVKIFADGQLWLDTNVILPMLGETLILDSAERPFTVLLRAAREAGIHLYVTEGVVEELERHINMCVTFARGSIEKWRSRVPFLYAIYAMSGRGRSEFASWVSQFRGEVRPEEDVADSIRDLFGIKVRNLKDEADSAELELRAAVQEVWQEVHDRRRGDIDELDSITRARLVDHDVENCVGVMQLRKSHPSSPVGYRAWFLTMDQTAFRLADELPARLRRNAPASPILSPDFLAEYLRLGVARTAVESQLRVNLPILTDIGRLGNLPKELISEAEKVRQRHSGLSERLIQREVRDTLDRERLRLGVRASGGLRAVKSSLAEKLRGSSA